MWKENFNSVIVWKELITCQDNIAPLCDMVILTCSRTYTALRPVGVVLELVKFTPYKKGGIYGMSNGWGRQLKFLQTQEMAAAFLYIVHWTKNDFNLYFVVLWDEFTVNTAFFPVMILALEYVPVREEPWLQTQSAQMQTERAWSNRKSSSGSLYWSDDCKQTVQTVSHYNSPALNTVSAQVVCCHQSSALRGEETVSSFADYLCSSHGTGSFLAWASNNLNDWSAASWFVGQSLTR